MTSETDKHAAAPATDATDDVQARAPGEGAAYFKGGGAAGVTAGDRNPPKGADDRFAAEDAETFGWAGADAGAGDHAGDRARIADREEGRQRLVRPPVPGLGDDLRSYPRGVTQRYRQREHRLSDTRRPRRGADRAASAGHAG